MSTATTEIELADAFELFLRERQLSGAPPRLSRIYREVPGIQGVADFVGIQVRDWHRQSEKLHRQFSTLPRGPSAELLDALRRPRSRASLIAGSAYTSSVLISALARMLDAGVVVQQKDEKFRLSSRFKIPDFQLYVFELKLSKWRRALAQATQAKIYANKSYCVFPATNHALVTKYGALFRKLEIGLLLFDPVTGRVVEPIRTRKTKSVRLAYQIDVLLRLATIEQNSKSKPPSDQFRQGAPLRPELAIRVRAR